MRQWNYLLDILGQNSFSLLGELRGREGNYGTLLVWSDETTDIGGGGGESGVLNNAFLTNLDLHSKSTWNFMHMKLPRSSV